MFTHFIGFIKSIFTPFFTFFNFLPAEFTSVLGAVLVVLVFVACKRTVSH